MKIFLLISMLIFTHSTQPRTMANLPLEKLLRAEARAEDMAAAAL